MIIWLPNNAMHQDLGVRYEVFQHNITKTPGSRKRRGQVFQHNITRG